MLNENEFIGRNDLPLIYPVILTLNIESSVSNFGIGKFILTVWLITSTVN